MGYLKTTYNEHFGSKNKKMPQHILCVNTEIDFDQTMMVML